MTQEVKRLSTALITLAVGFAMLAVLGPLVTGIFEYRYSQTMLNQATGLDAFALVVVAPLALLSAVLLARGYKAAPLLALGPAAFGLYMLVQYVIGPEYLTIDGNGERAFLVFVMLFVLSAWVLVQAWGLAAAPTWSDRFFRRRGVLLFGLAAFVVIGMYIANGFFSAMFDFPNYVEARAAVSEYDEHPTAYWIVAFLDLAVVVPLTVATGVGLLRRRDWARRAFYGVVGWYALVPGSVAAMALTMLARHDVAANAPKAIIFTAAAVAFFVLAARMFVPLFRTATWEDGGRGAGSSSGRPGRGVRASRAAHALSGAGSRRAAGSGAERVFDYYQR